MELIAGLYDQNDIAVLQSTLSNTAGIAVITPSEAGIEYKPVDYGESAADNSDINADILWNKAQDAAKLCFVLADAAPPFNTGDYIMILMAADGRKKVFTGEGENGKLSTFSQLSLYLKENPNIGTAAAKRQTSIYNKEQNRKKEHLARNIRSSGSQRCLLVYSYFTARSLAGEIIRIT